MKYALRFRRKGEEVEPQLAVVRRAARSVEREVAPVQHRLLGRLSRRRERAEVRDELDDAAAEFNAHGEVSATPPV